MSKTKEFYRAKDYNNCTSKQNEKGTWVTICVCKHGSSAHE